MVTGEMLMVIGVFYHWVDIRIVGRTTWHAGYDRWKWPPVEE